MGKLDNAVASWENSLLDLGKRNRMINFPIGEGRRRSLQTLRLDEPDYAGLYDLLVRQGKSLSIQQPPVEKFDLRCEGVMRLFERLGSPVVPMQGDVRPAGSFTEYRRTLKNLRAKEKLAREEQGIGVLYLAVGFLQWQQLTGRMEHLCSPLLLIPVRLKMKSIRAPYVLEMTDDDVVVNPALNQLFSAEYGLSLPELADQDAPVDDYLNAVDTLAQQHGWSIRRECHLALMSFQKISMYHDLKRNHDRIAKSVVLRAISGEAAYPMDVSVMDEVSLDAIPPEDSHLVVNADSSQQYAVELSRRGVSFCLQGPPGGGKSQTITNIIAQALADGRKVLFVAEKMAALDVVHRRLKEAGLGEFTLALHSHRASRKSILAELEQPLQLQRMKLDHQAMTALDELEAIRRSLNVYPALMHRRREPLGESLYSVLGELAEVHHLPLIMAEAEGAEHITRSMLNAEIARVTRYAHAYKRSQSCPDNPFTGLAGTWSSYMARTQLQEEASAALAEAERLEPVVSRLKAQGLLPDTGELDALPVLVCVCEAATQGTVSGEWFDHAEAICTHAARASEAAARAAQARHQAESVLLPGAQADFPELLARISALDSDLRAVLTGDAWQQTPDPYATQYAALSAFIQQLTGQAETALALMGCTLRTGEEADWALDAVSALAGIPAACTVLPDADAVNPILSSVRDMRRQVARLLDQQRELLGRDWTQEALALDADTLLHRFSHDYAGLARLLNLGRYHQDMQAISRVYCGTMRLDDQLARSFLTRLAAWQRAQKACNEAAGSITGKLNLPQMAPDADWGELEKQLTAQLALCHFADTPAHRALLTEALQRPSLRLHAGQITESRRYATLQPLLRSAAFSGSALEDDISRTQRSILTAAEDLLSLRDLLDSLRPSCRANVTPADMLEALRSWDEAERCSHMQTEARAALQELLPAGEVQADPATLHAAAGRIAQAAALSAQLPEGAVRALLTGAQPLPDMSFINGLAPALERLRAYSARFDAAEAPISGPFEIMCSRLKCCVIEPDALDLWLEWRDASDDMQGTLFAPFAAAVLRADLAAESWPDAARKLLLYTWVEHVLQEEHLISVFRAHTHQERISLFSRLDQQQLHIARSRIRKQLTDVMPDEKRRALAATDEVAILRRELAKKSGHLPLRRLFSRIPGLLTTLKPCLMMSPLSVASYLESDALSFDLVIFDEASQIMPENAIGAILRGKQVIVAGDTKQMPPTDFFSASVGGHDFDADDEEDVPEEDAPMEESILEQCAAVLPSCPLLWHYRSRHESLIAFSNREIYAGRLITFPGSIDRQAHLGVELVHVPDGVFHKRRNPQEAKRCIQLIEEHIRQRAERSLGVVAFSRTQQACIEEELHRFRIAHPEYDDFFDESRDEPFFIKNLENVQGDERDTMIFSVGYAKRENGRPMSLNLGPLSAAGGERRLNVAITRARCNVKLVTSVLARDIDLSRTNAAGTHLLRAYIDYAEKGFAAISGDDTPQSQSAPTPDAFAAHLARVLEKAGYQTERSVGCSGMRVDIAIRHPQEPERYALGVLVDGDSYAAQATCRDRDRLQASVLQGMGWQLHRVWSAEWLQRPDGVENALLAAAKAAVTAPAPAPGTPQEAPMQTWAHPEKIAVPASPAAFADYQAAHLPADSALPVSELVLRVVDTEQPVHRDELCRRLAPALGHDRVDPGLRRKVETALARLKETDLTEQDGFLSRRGFTPVRPRQAGHRPIDMISPGELQQAVWLVAESSIGAARGDILLRTSELLGFERRGPRIQRALESAFDVLLAAGSLQVTEDGRTLAIAASATSCLPVIPSQRTEVIPHD